MEAEETNPYSPPATINEVSAGIVTGPPQWVFALLVISAIAYHGFVLLLFLSPPDREVSIWFLANTPVFAVWLYRWNKARDGGAAFGIVGSVILLLIGCAILLTLEHADLTSVTAICGTIIAGFLSLTYVCHRQSFVHRTAAAH